MPTHSTTIDLGVAGQHEVIADYTRHHDHQYHKGDFDYIEVMEVKMVSGLELPDWIKGYIKADIEKELGP